MSYGLVTSPGGGFLIPFPWYANRAPTVNDDCTKGINCSDVWNDHTDGAQYICQSNATGSAVWNQIYPVTGAPPTGSAGGDLSGSYPNPTFNLTSAHTWTNTVTITPSSDSVVAVVTKPHSATATAAQYQAYGLNGTTKRATIDATGAFQDNGPGTGTNNAIFAPSSTLSLTTGSINCFFGTAAGATVTTGLANTMIGATAGGGVLTTGSYNFFIGYIAAAAAGNTQHAVGLGAQTTTASYNVSIGATAKCLDTSLNGAVSIGAGSIVDTTGNAATNVGSYSYVGSVCGFSLGSGNSVDAPATNSGTIGNSIDNSYADCLMMGTGTLETTGDGSQTGPFTSATAQTGELRHTGSTTGEAMMFSMASLTSAGNEAQWGCVDYGPISDTDASWKGYVQISALDYNGVRRPGIKIASNGSVVQIGLFGVTPVVQPQTTGTTTGFTANATTNILYNESTFTGGTGSNAYRVSDIVLALKQLGLLKA